MERQFGFGSPFFFPPFFPFFPRRRFFPFFFLFPFRRRRFFRNEEERNELFMEYRTQAGDTLETIADKYNVPMPILASMNPHLTEAGIKGGETIYIPRLNRIYCQQMFMEDEMDSDSGMPGAMYPGQQPGYPPQYMMQNMPMYPGMQQSPWMQPPMQRDFSGDIDS